MQKTQFCKQCLKTFFQQSCGAFKGSKFKIKSLQTSQDLNIVVKNIVFDRSVWSLVNMNINITSCDVHSMQIILHEETSMNNISVHITGSRIGSNIEMYTANAILDNCSMVHTKLPPEGPRISAVNSAVSVKSSHFENVDGRAFLWVTSGLAHLTDLHFLNVLIQ